MKKITVTLNQYKVALMKYVLAQKVSKKLAEDCVEAVLEHELKDNFFKGFKGTHGFDEWINGLKNSSTKKEILKVNKSALKVYDGNGKSPLHIILERFDEYCSLASENGTLTVGIKGEYMSALFYAVRKFADKGYLAILSSNGGPQGTVPYGGVTDIFGTNPLAYGIPSSTDPIVFDGATSKRAWGLIGEAKKAGIKLPEDTYFDASGEYTTDPEKAVKIEPFGGYKGYAVNLLLEVLTSTLVGGVAGREQKDKSELGTWLYIMDPGVFGDKKAFIAQVDRIKEEIVSTEPQEGFDRVVYPGQKAFEHSTTLQKTGEIEVDEEVWDKISGHAG